MPSVWCHAFSWTYMRTQCISITIVFVSVGLASLFVPINKHYHLFVIYNLHFLGGYWKDQYYMLTFFRHFMTCQVSLLHICDVLIILNTP